MSTARRIVGFTLIEILVVVAIIGSLIALAVPMLQNAQENAKVTECKSNQRQIAGSLKMYAEQRNSRRWPKECGIKFLLILYRDGMIAPKETKVFLCPGTEDINWTDEDPTPGSAYKEWDNLDPTAISYAGRDTKTHPINSNREDEEIIVADDNEFAGGNHRFATVFAYADGSVGQFDKFVDGKKRDLEFGKDDPVPVGPESPVAELQKLQID